MKKIIPVITLIGASALVVGVSNLKPNEKKEAFMQYINSFEKDVENASKIDTALTSTAMNKYMMTLSADLPQDQLINQIEELNVSDLESNNNSITNNEINTLTEESDSTDVTDNFENEESKDETIDNELNNDYTSTQISTLYALSSDIADSCDDFCELKKYVQEAIIETQNLIKKVQNKEIELTTEQRLFITEQAQQLKNLGRQLSSATTELSISLSDLNQLMNVKNQNLDSLSLKYLVVLDNLVNGNEMLESGLNTLNLMNQIFNANGGILPPNNHGRVLYGFRQNDNPPVIKDYYINENGDLIENSNNDENNTQNLQNEQVAEVNQENTNQENTAIDTYQDRKLKANIDTYQNRNTPRNIDTFFNTALLDNEFMYGNGNAYGGMYGMNNPYMQGYTNYEYNNTINGVDNANNTQNNKETTQKEKSKKEQRKIRLKKNIDTYKDENEPDIKTKLSNIKTGITGFFSKFKKNENNKKIENPVYRFNESNEDQLNG